MASSSSKPTNAQNKKTEKARRSWSQREEEVLITCLKDIIANGWKADNGFRVGYLQQLEAGINKAFPGSDLRALPHINSKIHVWKKNHGSLVSMLSRTGIGWNETDKMIDATDEAWDSYVKIDLNARLMRYKSWPYYNDWCEIFGKDRATGEHAEDVMEAVNELYNADKNQNEGLDDFNMSFGDFGDENETNSVYMSVSNGTEKTGSAKKRKSNGVEGLSEMLGSFCQNAEARLGDIAKRIGYEYDVASARKEVFTSLGKVSGLSKEEKLRATRLLAKSTEDLEVFFSLPEEEKADFVRMLFADN